MARARSRWLPASLVLAALAAAPAGARADGTADEADLHFRLGKKDFDRGDFDGALVHFMYSQRLVPNWRVVLNIGIAFDRLKRYVDAHRYYVDALEGATDPRTKAEVRAAIDHLAPNVAVLDVETVPPGATIYIDRKDLGSFGRAPRPLALAAGRHRVIAELEGYEPQAVDGVEVVQGAERKVSLALVRIVGTVRVAVEGGRSAAVRVDDERAAPSCQAPCDLQLPPGQHQLYFSAEAAQAEPRTVTVVARGLTNTSAVLRPLTGAIVVEAEERGARVTVDGRPSGFTPTVLQGVPVGRHRLEVSMRGYTPVDLEVDVQPGRQAEPPMVRLVPVREVEAVSRYSQSIDDAPSSVTIISREEIAAFGYPTIAAALQGVRGFSISTDRAYAAAGVRGLGQPDDYGNRLLVLSDGQSLNDNIASSSAIGSNARVDLHDVDRIEVVRGPGSLLYGTGAFSGVVNLVSRPRDEPNGVHVGFGVYDDAVVHGRAGFHYNFTSKVGMWASVSAAHSEGYDLSVPGVPQPPPPGGPGGPATQVAHQVDAFSSVNTAGRAWWGPATLQWFYQYRSQIVPVGAYQTPFDNPGTSLADTRMMAELRVEPHISDKVELLLRAHANRSVSYETFAAPAATGPSVEDYVGTWFGGEARLVVTPLPWLRLTGGGEYQAHPQAAMTGQTFPPDSPATTYLDEKKPFQLGAGYLVGELSPKPWVRATAGARLDGYSTFGTVVVPRASLIFKPGQGGVLKIMGGRAFRAPSVYEQLYHSPGFEAPGNDVGAGFKLKPESIWSGEVEYSQRFLEDWVALVAGYGGYVEHLIDTINDPVTMLKRYENSASPALLAGGDVEIRREFRRGWMLSASYGYERAQFISSSLTDPRLLNAPEHMASFRGIAPVIRDLVIAALRLTLEAPRRIGFDSSATTSTALIADAAISGNLRDYGLHYTVGVYNIADVRYPVPVSSTFATPTLPQNGRTFLIDLLGTFPPN